MGKTRPRALGALFDHYAETPGAVWHLDRPFDIAPDGGRSHDSASLAALVRDMSARLYAAGVRRGDRIAIIKENHLDTVLLAAAAGRVGALPAMITDTFSPETLAKMMPRLTPRVIIASHAVLSACVVAGVDLAGPGTNTVVIDGTADGLPGAVALSEYAGADVPAMDLQPDSEPMVCTHTSGTTGVPKFVTHSADTLIGAGAKMETMRIPFLSTRPDDTIASCIAFVHSRAVTWTYAQFVLPPAKAVVLSRPDIDGTVETLGAHRPTTLEACPNIFQLWERLPRSHPELFTGVRAYLSTFDAIHPGTVRTFLAATRRRNAVWGQSWGQSEVGPTTLAVYTKRKALRTPAAGSGHKGGSKGAPLTNSVGRPVPFSAKVRVVDPETRRPLRRGRRGLVLIRTKSRCLTYLGEHERFREKDWDGWWNTGDIGFLTRSGAVHVLDREVDAIPGTSGIELESLLLERLPEATEVIVLGNPGGRPVPVLSTHDGTLDPEAWRQATDGLPELDEPRIIPWEDFPRTGTWKVRRTDLRRMVLRSEETFGTGRWT